MEERGILVSAGLILALHAPLAAFAAGARAADARGAVHELKPGGFGLDGHCARKECRIGATLISLGFSPGPLGHYDTDVAV
jgi:hypothetical protein